MEKVIETNISFDSLGGELIPKDTQSRVVEVENWDKYVEEIREQHQIHRKCIIGHLVGVSFPKGATMKTFNANDERLICTFCTYDGKFMMKTAYLCK